MVADATGEILILADALPTSAHAYIYGIRQLDQTTGVWYSIFPEGVQGHCQVGGGIWVDFGIQNDGTATGTLYAKVTRLDTGVVLYNQGFTLAVGGQQTASVNFTMPNNNVSLRFEIGHT